MLLHSGLTGDGLIIVLQPRRMACRLLARRVASELGEPTGKTVGYQMRLERCFGRDTRILYVTEGILLRRMVDDAALSGVAAVIFDEFHERHLHGDVCLALARRIQRERRPDLIIGVMSATLDAAPLRAYLSPCELLHSEGRTYPVAIEYQPAGAGGSGGAGAAEPWDAAARAFRHLARGGLEGDVLIFMPGAREIRRTINAILELPEARGVPVLPLYGELPAAEQDAAVDPGDRPRVIVSTNIAETSLTLPGVRAVIDSGLARVPAFDAARGINTLHIERICRASADQRAGRAGRTAPGRCLRLWSEREHEHRAERTDPEIARLDLTELVLSLKAYGINDLSAFDWYEPPPAARLEHALDLLRSLGALSDGEDADMVTDLGRTMAAFPLHPRFARMLVEGGRRGCLAPVALLAALDQDRSLLLPLGNASEEERRREQLGVDYPSDHLLWLTAWQAAAQRKFDHGFCVRMGIHRQVALRAGELMQSMLRIAKDHGLGENPAHTDQAAGAEAILRALLAGFPDLVVVRERASSRRCRMSAGRSGEIAPESIAEGEGLYVVTEIEERGAGGGAVKVLLRGCSRIESRWLREQFPERFREVAEARWDEERRRVEAVREEWFGGLLLTQTAGGDAVDAGLAARILAQEVAAGRLNLKLWNQAVEDWIARVNTLAIHFPEYGIAPIGAEDRLFLLEQICHGSVSYKEIKDREVMPVLRQWLTAETAPLLDRLVPERFELPNGKGSVKLRYDGDGGVVVAATIQQFYDVPGERLRIGDGRIRLTVELLAPSRRPVQVTSDLDGFWGSSYPAIRKELAGRYPKHEWR